MSDVQTKATVAEATTPVDTGLMNVFIRNPPLLLQETSRLRPLSPLLIQV